MKEDKYFKKKNDSERKKDIFDEVSEEIAAEQKNKKNRAIRKNKVMTILTGKISGLAITLVQLIITVIFLCYVLKLNILPGKYFVPCAVIMFFMFVVTYTAQMFRRIRNPFKVISILLSIAMIYIQATYFVPLKGVISNIGGSNTVINMMNVYTLKDEPANTIEEMRDYTFGYIRDTMVATLSKDTIRDIEEKAGFTLKTKEYMSYDELVEALFNKDIKVIIMNQAYEDLIIDEEHEELDDSMQAKFQTFKENTKIIKTINIVEKVEQAEPQREFDITRDPFCVYFSGIDVYGKISRTSRSDVNILAFINPGTKQVLLLNTPRDSYVTNPHSGNVKDKLTHAGIYGIDSSIGALENLYGLEIDYYFRVNFTGFEKIIDALGGINVYSDYNFHTKHGGGYDFVKGYNWVDGKAALAFSRERYAFNGGDRQRGKNHMAVISAIINEMASSKLLTNYTPLMKSIKGAFETSISESDISKLIKMQLNDMSGWNVKSFSVDGTGSMEYTYTSPKGKRYVMILKDELIQKAKVLVKQVYDGEVINLDAVR